MQQVQAAGVDEAGAASEGLADDVAEESLEAVGVQEAGAAEASLGLGGSELR